MPTRYSGTEEEVRALNAYINLMRASQSVYAKVERSLGLQGFTVSQFGILEALFHVGPMCQKDLAKKVLKTEGNLTTVITTMEKRGLVKREVQENDRRYITVTLTPKGRSLISDMFPIHVMGVARMFRCLSLEEQESLRGICRTLGKSIQKES